MQLNNISKAVVVPFDFSEMSCQALITAAKMVGDPSLLKVINVTEYPSAYEYGVVWETVNQDTIVERIKESFEKKRKEYGTIPEVDITVKFGDPGREVCYFAKDHKADLIIMPSHGRKGFERFFLGSVAERVVRFAPCPVLILRDEGPEKESLASDLSSTAV